MMHHRQHGFTLISAVFIIVILASLGAYMVSISGTQTNVPVSAVQGARAYNAARSASEWAAYLILNAPNAATACANVNGQMLNLNTPGLVNFNVNVTCTRTNHTEGTIGNFDVMTILSTARFSSFGDPDYIERVLHTTLVVK